MTTEQLARAFVAAGTELGKGLAESLATMDPALAEKVADAVKHGERLQLSIDFGPETTVRLCTVDDDGSLKRVMRIATTPLVYQ